MNKREEMMWDRIIEAIERDQADHSLCWGGVGLPGVGALIRMGKIPRLQDVFGYITPEYLSIHVGMDARVLEVMLRKNVGKMTGEHTTIFAEVLQVEEELIWMISTKEAKTHKREKIRRGSIISLA